ncbi:MAG: ABC transporter permease [Verrucomicrobiae bacterium]|nr:ABC transporter permease [Verrucomicrobiae bacterium]NNJ85542.1 ABC transporter permease subunit [Akkermansiaceae bacterium]
MRRNGIFSPGRILVIAGHTFTQLVRMKVFYFLAVFALLMLAMSYFEGPWSRAAEDSAEQVLIDIKGWATGAMLIFSTIIAIASTALLIPKDLEDRTLYTILSKPVPRLDYLLGKLFGVFALIAISLLLMDVMLSVILHLRTDDLLSQEMEIAKSLNWPPEYVASRREDIMNQGVTWGLQAGIGALLMKACIMASIALLISTFSSSTLFTIVISVVIFCIGHFTADARNYWLHTQAKNASQELKFFSQAIALIFPDFQLYNINDAANKGKAVSPELFGYLVKLTFFYTGIYSLLAWFTFRKKEF